MSETTLPLDDAPVSPDRFCPDCRYDLRGAAHERCPECGLDMVALREVSSIPWCDGKSNVVWGFVRTAWRARFTPHLLLREIVRPPDMRTAQAFRFACIGLVVLSVLGAIGFLVSEDSVARTPQTSSRLGAFATGPMAEIHQAFGTGYLLFCLGCVVLGLVFVTGVQSYCFHPRSLSLEHQNRSLVLSYYISASLLWIPLTLVLAIGSARWLGIGAGFVAAVGLVVLAPLDYLRLTNLYADRLLGPGRGLKVTLTTAFAALGCVAVALVALPLAGLLVALTYYSLQP